MHPRWLHPAGDTTRASLAKSHRRRRGTSVALRSGMQPSPIELTNEELTTARGGFDIGGLLNGAFSMAKQAGAPAQELGMAQQAASMAMPLIQGFLGGGGSGG
jgi:hypothetical protein